MLVIGINPVLETLNYNPNSIENIFIFSNITNSKINKIIEIAKQKNISVKKILKPEFEKFLEKKDKSEGISQGVIAICKDFEYSDFSTLLAELALKKSSLLVILDEIQDPHNLGAIIRTSAGAGVDALIISEKNSAKINHTVIKTSSGATNYIKICMVTNLYKAISLVKESGFTVYGTSLKAKKNHYECSFSNKTVLVFGNEAKGLRKNITDLCDELIKIPLNKNVESLNVSVSAGVVIYEALRKMKIS